MCAYTLFTYITKSAFVVSFFLLSEPTSVILKVFLSFFAVSQLPNTVQVALGGLQRQLEEAVQRQTAVIEDKIRIFTAEQYQLLEQFRERAHNEHRLLSKYDPQ